MELIINIALFTEAISPSDYFSDQRLELLRALEMSRLQFLREMGSLKPGSGDRCVQLILANLVMNMNVTK